MEVIRIVGKGTVNMNCGVCANYVPVITKLTYNVCVQEERRWKGTYKKLSLSSFISVVALIIRSIDLRLGSKEGISSCRKQLHATRAVLTVLLQETLLLKRQATFKSELSLVMRTAARGKKIQSKVWQCAWLSLTHLHTPPLGPSFRRWNIKLNLFCDLERNPTPLKMQSNMETYTVSKWK